MSGVSDNTKSIVFLLFPEIQLSTQGFLIAMRKPIRNACFGTVKHD